MNAAKQWIIYYSTVVPDGGGRIALTLSDQRKRVAAHLACGGGMVVGAYVEQQGSTPSYPAALAAAAHLTRVPSAWLLAPTGNFPLEVPAERAGWFHAPLSLEFSPPLPPHLIPAPVSAPTDVALFFQQREGWRHDAYLCNSGPRPLSRLILKWEERWDGEVTSSARERLAVLPRGRAAYLPLDIDWADGPITVFLEYQDGQSHVRLEGADFIDGSWLAFRSG